MADDDTRDDADRLFAKWKTSDGTISLGDVLRERYATTLLHHEHALDEAVRKVMLWVAHQCYARSERLATHWMWQRIRVAPIGRGAHDATGPYTMDGASHAATDLMSHVVYTRLIAELRRHRLHVMQVGSDEEGEDKQDASGYYHLRISWS